MFPVYDFTREITSGSAEVSLMLRQGTDPHDFEPSPMDIKALHDADVFVFTGRSMEHWAERISSTLEHTAVIDASEGIALTDNDPHVWLDLELAQKMVMNIALGLCSADPPNSETYSSNAKAYCEKLASLDQQFMSLDHSKPLVFAGEFSYSCFIRRYSFEYISAFEGENEPGIKRMAEVIKYITSNNIRFVLSDNPPLHQVTRAICEQTGAEVLTFSSVHNVPADSTFLRLMTESYHSIARFLND